ncbi:MAG: DUF5606 domain-containing protein [Cyclobacteriaceae bacterium]|nr:DUF5606 domain-containing protein [Cyclobacteriaceae bacterium]
MELKELASISGKGGLFRVVKPGKAGMILESLDETKTRLVANPNMKMSLLDEISIYTRTKEGTAPLSDVLKKIQKEFPGDLGVDGNSDPEELRAFLKSVLPEFDEDRVYPSDIKKLVKWFEIIRKAAPEVLAGETDANKN